MKDGTYRVRLRFDEVDVHRELLRANSEERDDLPFGLIGMDQRFIVRVYNTYESEAAGLAADRVLGLHLFQVVAPCMNNFMVAQRFEDAAENGTVLDATIDYVLTLRMRPTKVQLRLLSIPGERLNFVLVRRLAA